MLSLTDRTTELSSIEEIGVGLDGVSRTKLAEKSYKSSQEVPIIASITFQWSPFVRCPVYDKPRLKFVHSSNQIEDNRKRQN
jgi:hypothetical protein